MSWRNDIIRLLPLKGLKRLSAAFLISTTVFAGLPFAPVAQAATQNHYLWRNDDGTAATTVDTSLTISPGTSKRLRLDADGTSTEQTLIRQAGTTPSTSSANISASVIDEAAGYAYTGSGNGAAEIVKIRLSDHTPVARIVLNEAWARTAVIDTTGGTHYAYFGTYAPPGSPDPGTVVKVDLTTFTEVGTVPLDSSENQLVSSVIDTTGGTHYAYFGTNTSPGKVVKINLSTFTEAGPALTFSAASAAWTAVIDTTGPTHFAYFGTYEDSPAQVVKINLTTFEEDSTLALDAYTYGLDASVIDTTHGYAYFVSGAYNPATIAKVDLATFHEADNTSLVTHGAVRHAAAAIDSTGIYAYFGLYGTPGHVVKFNLTVFAEEDAPITLGGGENYPDSFFIDAAGGNLYAPENINPAHISVISLSSFAVTSTLVLDHMTGDLAGAVIDTLHGYAYFMSNASGKLRRIHLSDFTDAGELDLGGYSRTGVIDPVGGYAYYALDDAPGTIVKIQLSDFSLYDSLPLQAEENYPETAAIDPVHGYAYFGVDGGTPDHAKVVRLNLSSFTEDGTIDLGLDDSYVTSVAADLANNRIYFATSGSPSHLYQVDTSIFNVTDSYAFASGEDGLYSMVVDSANQTAYVGMSIWPSAPVIVQVNLASMTRGDSLTIGSGGNRASSATIDAADRYAYFTLDSAPAHVIQIDLANFVQTDELALNSGNDELYGQSSVLDSDHGYLYVGSGEQDGPITKVQTFLQPRSYRLEYGETTSSCNLATGWTQVGTPSGSGDWVMAPSANVTNGEATSHLVGLTNGNPLFYPGQAMDTASQTGPIALGRDESTEVEFSVTPGPDADPGAHYCFRLTDAGSAAPMTFTNYAEAQMTGAAEMLTATTSNRVVLSRLKAGEVAQADVYYHLADTLDGLLTVTFPAGFTVLTPATGGSGCLDDFNSTTSTLTARKTGCTGDVVMTGATVRNPATPGDYPITWVNDDPGGSSVYIMSDDQVGVDATVEPSISFDVGAQSASVPCSGAFTGDGGVVALGVIPLGQVVSSDVNGVSHICTRLSTNAASGATVTVKSDNAALMSSSNHADLIPSLTANGGDNVMHAGTANYGLCADGVSGVADTTPESAPVLRNDPFKTICTDHTAAGNVGAVTTSAQTIWHVEHATSNAYQSLEVKAAISGTTAAHSDYGDTLTFVATGTF